MVPDHSSRPSQLAASSSSNDHDDSPLVDTPKHDSDLDSNSDAQNSLPPHAEDTLLADASDADSPSDSDVPDSIPLAQSRRSVRQRNAAVEKVRASERAKVKARNRERDQWVKEGVAAAGKKSKAKAQGEAKGENGNEDKEEEGASSKESAEDEDRGEAVGSDEDEEVEESSLNQESRPDMKVDTKTATKLKPNPKYLPDHLFASAFISQPSATPSSSSSKKRKLDNSTDDRLPRGSRKRAQKTHRIPKDLIVGSTAVRTLPNHAQQRLPLAAASTVSSRKAQKFIDKSLGLKVKANSNSNGTSGMGLNSKGWERRPVNIGVLKRDGPASNFVRRR